MEKKYQGSLEDMIKGMEKTQTTPEQTKTFWNKMITEAMGPHLSEMDRGAFIYHRVAVVPFELHPHPKVTSFVRWLGWDEKSPFFVLAESKLKRFAANLETQGDLIAAKWLRSGRYGRIFLCVGFGTFLMNFDREKGFSVEPGSTMSEYH
jgi:hypothetical protein